MYMTASLGWPCEKTTFPFGYVATRRVAPADSRKASASKAVRFSCGSTWRVLALGIGVERIISCGDGPHARPTALMRVDWTTCDSHKISARVQSGTVRFARTV